MTEAHRLKSVDIPKYVQGTYVLPSGSITVGCFCDKYKKELKTKSTEGKKTQNKIGKDKKKATKSGRDKKYLKTKLAHEKKLKTLLAEVKKAKNKIGKVEKNIAELNWQRNKKLKQY